MKNANVAIFVPNLGCPHACSFCDQREIAGQEEIPTPEFVRETAKKALSDMGENAKNAEIAFFGGSFTCIERKFMEELLAAAYPFTVKTNESAFKGIRISTRPDAITPEILDVLKSYNVKAIELGAQSMDNAVLKMNSRGHTADDIVNASKLIKDYGFELGLQMMTGLYGSDDNKDIETAKKIAELGPKTVRIYPTITLEGTALATFYKRGLYKPSSLDDAVRLCAKLLTFFEDRGITVIRLGLHSMPSLVNSYVAGPWHPAFRELCQNVIYFDKAHKAIENAYNKNIRSGILYVGKSEVSKLSGQHRKNLNALEKEFNITLKIKELDLPKLTVKFEPDNAL